MVCPNCDKKQVSPEERCSCREDWQFNKCFKLNEAIENFFLVYDTTSRTKEDWDGVAEEFRKVYTRTL